MDTYEQVTSAPPDVTRILIADRRLVRMGIRMALEEEPSFRICAAVGDAGEAVRLAKLSSPDVCLVGLDIPGGGIHAVEAICAADAAARVIVIATADRVEDLLACLSAGAMGYLLDTTDGDGLRKAVAGALRDEPAISRSLVRHLIAALRSMNRGGAVTTVRETQVLEALRRGQTTANIAHQLGISPVTVRRHISGLVHKLGVDDRAALAHLGHDGAATARDQKSA